MTQKLLCQHWTLADSYFLLIDQSEASIQVMWPPKMLKLPCGAPPLSQPIQPIYFQKGGDLSFNLIPDLPVFFQKKMWLILNWNFWIQFFEISIKIFFSTQVPSESPMTKEYKNMHNSSPHIMVESHKGVVWLVVPHQCSKGTIQSKINWLFLASWWKVATE